MGSFKAMFRGSFNGTFRGLGIRVWVQGLGFRDLGFRV